MADALKVIPEDTSVKSGVRDVAPVADGLASVLADSYRLMFKTHAYHWNVEGPLFYSIHNLTEEQYENMFEAADELSERIRSLGKMAPMSMSEIIERSIIEDKTQQPSAGEMCEDLANEHERVAHRLHALVELTEERKDVVTED